MDMEKTQDQINEERLLKLEESAGKAAIAEENDLFYDFDKAIEEANIKPFEIKFMNEIIKVPAEMPFDFSMFFFRNCVKKVNGKEVVEIPDSCVYEFMLLMFGENFISKLEKTRLGLNFIFETVALKILKKWGYDIKAPAKKENVQKKI